MRLFTKKQLEAYTTAIREKAFLQGENEGFKEGHKVGLHKGMIQDREGVVMNEGGLFFFKDGEEQPVIISDEVRKA